MTTIFTSRRFRVAVALILCFAARAFSLPSSDGWALAYLLSDLLKKEYQLTRDGVFPKTELGRAKRGLQFSNFLSNRLGFDPEIKDGPKNATDSEMVIFLEQELADSKEIAFWQLINTAVLAANKHCDLKDRYRVSYIKIAEERSLQAGVQGNLLDAFKGWNQSEILCLARQITGDELSQKNNYASQLFQEMRYQNSPIAKDESILALNTLLFFRAGNYPETLRILADHMKVRPELKVIYQRIQRVFGSSQKGQGDVALRQEL